MLYLDSAFLQKRMSKYAPVADVSTLTRNTLDVTLTWNLILFFCQLDMIEYHQQQWTIDAST